MIDVVPLTKDIIVIFRQNEAKFDFDQFETLFFASWKINT